MIFAVDIRLSKSMKVFLFSQEMQTQFENFMQDWIASMEKENPEVVSKMKTGVERMIDEGRSKDSVWEVLCCASKAHKINVNTIEELTKVSIIDPSPLLFVCVSLDKQRFFLNLLSGADKYGPQ